MKFPFWLRPTFLYAPDGVSSASSAEAALDAVFGGLERARPDLAAHEDREKERKAKGEPPKVGPERGRPAVELETERPAEKAPPVREKAVEETEEDAPPAARKDAPPAEEEEQDTGRDHESPNDDETALDAVIEKYQGNPKSMAKAIRGLRNLTNQKAEERKELLARIERASAVIDRDYEEVNGEYRLKPEVAARHLAAQRKTGRGPIAPPDEKAIRRNVVSALEAKAKTLMDAEDVKRYMESMEDHIEEVVRDKMERASIAFETSRFELLKDVGSVVDRHLRDNPGDKELLKEIDEFYKGIPEDLRVNAILEEWIPFGHVAELVRLKKNFRSAIKEAFEQGRKSRGSVVPTDGGSPGRSGQGRSPQRGRGDDSERVFKDRLIGGTGLPSLDSIVSR